MGLTFFRLIYWNIPSDFLHQCRYWPIWEKKKIRSYVVGTSALFWHKNVWTSWILKKGKNPCTLYNPIQPVSLSLFLSISLSVSHLCLPVLILLCLTYFVSLSIHLPSRFSLCLLPALYLSLCLSPCLPPHRLHYKILSPEMVKSVRTGYVKLLQSF